MDLKALTNLEDHYADFKSRLTNEENIAKTLIAFANGKGGKVVVGVEDKTRIPIGLREEEVYRYEEWITNVAFDYCHPLIRPYAAKDYCDGKLILVVTVYPGTSKPYHLKGIPLQEGTYIRVGSSNRLADPDMIRELERQARNIGFDEELVRHYGVEIIDRDVLHRYFVVRRERRGVPVEDVDENLLFKLRVVAREEDSVHPNYGGVILYSKDPRLLVPHSRIRCARFKGTRVEEFIDKQDLEGPIIDLVNGAMSFVKRNIRLGAKVKGVYLEEQYEYPLDAVREAILNAVIHRDYSLKADIRLAIFDDLMEITSPGLLPPNITVETLGTGVSAVRNRVIARNLKEMAMFEEWGRGTRIIRDKMQEWGLPDPEYEEVGLDFRVVLRGRGETPPTDAVRLNERQLWILQFLRENPSITRKVVTDHFRVSSVTASKDLNKLADLGLTSAKGKGPATYYVLN